MVTVGCPHLKLRDLNLLPIPLEHSLLGKEHSKLEPSVFVLFFQKNQDKHG